MSGEAQSEKFGLGSATVMIGPVADLFNFRPDVHSIGLVKNFGLKADQQYQKLTQGVKNSQVYSVLTGNNVSAGMEVYEYTSQNLAYGLGLNGSTLAPTTVATTVLTEMALTGEATALTCPVVAADGFTVGDYVFVQIGSDDRVYVRKLTAVDTVTDILTFDKTLPEVIPVGASVKKVNVIFGGSKKDQPFMAAKIIGMLADGTEIAMLIPKIRVSGFALDFKTDNFGNMPFAFEVFDLVPADPFYNDFKDEGNMMIAQVS